MNKETIKATLEGMFNFIEKEKIELYKSLIDKSVYANNIKDFQDFYLNLVYPYNNFLEGSSTVNKNLRNILQY